ncbi:alpha/beta fold hydrolase [Lutimaribacter marinistellae]|uniref:Alpha/beta fold hydrolase n=1 Tax=Lutimaribacter marinistellae TaxID=1820329 RepID=A0ABV7TB68_9RHOB
MLQTPDPEGLKEQVVAVGAREIHVTEVGDGPVVIKLHGGGPGASGMSNFSRNVSTLAQRFRVIVPDMPGYGQSTKRLDQSDVFGDLAHSMIGLMDALGIERASVVGNSLGGATALRMAMDHPGRIDRLVLMGPGGVGGLQGGPSLGLQKLIGYYKGDGPSREKLAEFLREFLVADGTAVSDEMIEARYRASIDPEVVANPPLQVPNDPQAMARLDLSADPRMTQIDHPTLALWGDADRVNLLTGGHWLRENMKSCDLYIFAGVGHWVQWERAAEFNAVCTAFLSANADV